MEAVTKPGMLEYLKSPPPPLPYLKVNNTDTTLHLQNLHVHGNHPQHRKLARGSSSEHILLWTYYGPYLIAGGEGGVLCCI